MKKKNTEEKNIYTLEDKTKQKKEKKNIRSKLAI